MSDAASNEPPRPRRFGFSLRTLLLLVVIVALGLAHFVTLRELLQLRKENATLRVQAGHLENTDPEKASVLLIPSLDELSMRWKVHLPAGKWFMHYASHNIPAQGLVPSEMSLPATAGDKPEMFIEARVGRRLDGELVLITRFDDYGRSNAGTGVTHLVPPDRGFLESLSLAGGSGEETADPDRPIVLMRLRTPPPTAGGVRGIGIAFDASMGPCDGLLIWLDRK